MPDQRIADLLERLCESVESLSKAIRSTGKQAAPFDGEIFREILTEEEVASLTGLKSRSRQIRWLRENGWIHESAAGGRPLVGRLYLKQKLGGRVGPDQKAPAPTWTLDLSKIK
ncbi:DUF4224 domain-containing protein [Metapseudomonas otitidis]|uniref:DUF4224 domain-containing protein n=1 Tax=Metapseudomonas otitidis TaxID=319939 RepID=A0A679GGC4_9GAMM|nr:DUF4224 domain-containing protein [Pseudomonas otitidis]BCA30166.1 hypothetical protein PtoMrB4_41430 [Pseudomonas otitidis]